MKYKKIITHYEKCFDKHGDTALGMDWPDENDAKLRHEVMSELMKYTGNILDFGCGTGYFLEFLKVFKMFNHHNNIKSEILI